MLTAVSLSTPVAGALLVLWLLALGGAIGSFLNVVVYRLPAGMSLVRPGSRCPACKNPIRWRDNVPVFGWILLKGRCRDCGTKISPRYPIVEGVTASVFFVIGVVEIVWGGRNLPVRPVPVDDGFIYLTPGVVQASGIAAYHLLLLGTLLAACLIEYDGHKVPLSLTVPALLLGGMAPLVWPHLHPAPVWPELTGWLAGLVDGAAGLAAGLLAGLVAWPLAEPKHRFGLLLALGCVGLFLGWQAVAVTATLSVTAGLLAGMAPTARQRLVLPSTWLAATAFGWIVFWKPLVDRWPFLGST